MVDVLLFHHVQGLTEGVTAFADDLRAGGHTVHTPDLFDGRTFGSIEDGFAYTKSLDEGTIDQRVAAAAEGLPSDLVYAGVSYGVPPALELTVKRAGARGLVMIESAMPIEGEWAVGPFPEGVPLQIHGGEGDEYFQEDKPSPTRPWSSSESVPSCSSTPPNSTCSPTAACRRTTPSRPPSSPSACWRSSTSSRRHSLV